MPDTHVPFERVDSPREERKSTRRRLIGSAAAGALVFSGLRLPKAAPANAQQLGVQAKRTFRHRARIVIRDQNTASPFPAVIDVRNMPGSILANSGVKVTLHGLTHDNVQDVCAALVSPTGTAVWLMGEVGGNTSVSNLKLTIFQTAPNDFTQTSLTSGSYKPFNFGKPGNNSVFPSPAPAPITSEDLDDFSGLAGDQLNGQWKLYVFDNHRLAAGVISGGWSLEITTTNSPPKARNISVRTRLGKTLKVKKPGVLRKSSDPDRDRLRVTPIRNKKLSNGRVTVRRNGTIIFRPTNTGRDKVRFTVNDPSGETDSAWLKINVKK